MNGYQVPGERRVLRVQEVEATEQALGGHSCLSSPVLSPIPPELDLLRGSVQVDKDKRGIRDVSQTTPRQDEEGPCRAGGGKGEVDGRGGNPELQEREGLLLCLVSHHEPESAYSCTRDVVVGSEGGTPSWDPSVNLSFLPFRGMAQGCSRSVGTSRDVYLRSPSCQPRWGG